MRSLRILLVLMLVAGAGYARADDAPSPEALQAANELLAILSPDMMKQLTGQITTAFWPAVEHQARANNIDDATIGELRKEFERSQVAFLADAMKEAPQIYAEHFTVAELHELSAFYRTPAGAKALSEMPHVMGDLTTRLVPRLQDLQRQTAESFTKILHERGYGK
jgi:hypothetical protein